MNENEIYLKDDLSNIDEVKNELNNKIMELKKEEYTENQYEVNLETLDISISDFSILDVNKNNCFLGFTYENDTNECFLLYNIFSGIEPQRKKIQKNDFDYFSKKISNITKNWKDYYGRDIKNKGPANISWGIIFDRNDKNKIYEGNDYPYNWNEFMDCLAEIKTYFNID